VRNAKSTAAVVLLIGLAVTVMSILVSGATGASTPTVNLIRIDATINPGVAEYLDRAIKDSEAEKAEALIVELDTPGGLADSMRDMVKNIMESTVPVIVYVAPSGARAASAGVVITLAANVAVMAPGTNIGAASPVSIGIGGGEEKMGDTMKRKVMNDMVAYVQSIAEKRGRNANWAKKAVTEAASITDVEAVINRVVDLRADSVSDLLDKVNGRKVQVAGGEEVTLHTKDAKVVVLHEQFREKLLRTLANPNIAYLLMLIGLAGLYFEFTNPGAIFPGAVGALSLILAFYALNTLPVNYAGVMLILLGILLFIAEIKITSYGFLTVGGIVCLLLGSLMLFKNQPGGYMVRVSWSVILPTVAAVTLFFTVIVGLVVRAQVRRPTTGAEGLVGELGTVLKEVSPAGGKVFVHGETWNALSDEVIEQGATVEVVRMEQLKVRIKRVSYPQTIQREGTSAGATEV
jgi:membrane-bound serine protease (ClpP class)